MFYETVKRVLDLLVAVILAIIFSPFFLIVPVIIKLTSPGPVFYGQKRVGKNGREFTLYKFRSMVVNADEIIAKDKDLLKKFQDSDWKLDMKDDPRITKFGAFIRTFTIDEFPQILNVFRGEMSVVGPRAYRQEEIKQQLAKYPKARSLMKDILKIKPGITGPWQTSGRNEVPFLQRAKLDAAYYRSRSIWQDILILLKTPKAMLSKW
ncbi:MAG: sugar transferase [Candidatus Pacebacteria bacterium]|nr:sugar transferase [Candidatus Paceibacterota bacterium]